MNYYYRPEVAALVTAYVNYLTPVKGADAILLKDDPDIANNPLIFPPADVRARLYAFGAALRGGRVVLQRGVRQGERRLSRDTTR